MAQVDTTIWGPLRTSENWQTVLGEDVHYTQNVSTTLNTGNDTHEALDNSVCIFGFGYNSPAVHAVACSYNFDTEQMVQQPLFPTKTQIPWALAWADDASYGYTAWDTGYGADKYVYGNNYRWVNTCPTEGSSYDEEYLGVGTKPLWFFNNDFDYQKKWMVFVLPVCLSTHTVSGTTYKEGKTSGVFVTLKDWYDNYKDKYQGICQIIMAPTTYNQNLPSNSGGLSFSLFSNIVDDLNIEYQEGDPRYNTQRIDGNFYAYRTYTGAYSHIEGDYFNGYMTIAGGLNIRNDMNVNLSQWTPLFMPTVGDWTVHCILPESAGGTGDGWGIFAGYDPGTKTFDDVEDEIAQIAAHMGTFFIFDMADKNKENDDYNVFLGLLDEYAISTGNYSRGEANRDSDQFDWDTASEGDYDPGKEPPFIDKNDYNTPMHFNQPFAASLNKLYVISKSLYNQYNLERLYTSLWKVIDDHYETAYSYDMGEGHDDLWFGNTYSNFAINNFFTMNPIDAIISIKLFPYDTAISRQQEAVTTVRLGPYNTTISAFTANTTKHIEDFTGLQIAPYFGDCWIDRLTEYTLYVPFCGTLRLDPNIYMGKTIYLDYMIDQVTGACTATVRTVAKGSNGQDIETHEDSISGIVAADIPITGLNQATLQSQLYNANQQLKAGLWQTAAGIGTGALQISSAIAGGNVIQGATSAIGGINNFIQNDIKNQTNEYNLHHTEVAPRTVGSASPLTGLCMQYEPVLLISKPTIPKGFNEAEYAATKGYACLISGTIGENHGYCVAQNPKLDIACTETEKEMIRSLLASGVYV